MAATVGGPLADRDFRRAWFLELAAYALASMPGGRDELRRVVDPDSRTWSKFPNHEMLRTPGSSGPSGRPREPTLRARRCGSGSMTATATLQGFAFCRSLAGMSHLGALAATADLAHWNGCGSSSIPIAVRPGF